MVTEAFNSGSPLKSLPGETQKTLFGELALSKYSICGVILHTEEIYVCSVAYNLFFLESEVLFFRIPTTLLQDCNLQTMGGGLS